VSGCLYSDPINQRPSVTIEGEPTDVVHRADHLTLSAQAEDPDGHYIRFQWRAYACAGAVAEDGCDTYPFADGLLETFELDVPVRLEDDVTPVTLLRVVLQAKDELGATARPEEELLLPVANRAPTLELDRSSRYSFIKVSPINVYAKVSDVDDGAAAIEATDVEWKVYGPPLADTTNALIELTIPDDPEDPDHRQFGRVFTANVEGEWTIEVTARDPLGATTTVATMITVSPGTPPCLAQVQPIVPPVGALLPITDPTLFQVPVVVDDLDVYPPQAGDPFLGTADFKWYVQAPGQSAHVEVPGATGNSYAVDPASYTPGDLLEVRVEIYDRDPDTLVNCALTDATCAVNTSTPSCIQRQTWRVEVR